MAAAVVAAPALLMHNQHQCQLQLGCSSNPWYHSLLLLPGPAAHSLLLPLLQVLFQFTYTTMFGWYATYLFIRTGHLVAPVLSHALCNALGLPPVVQMVQHKQRWLMMVLLVAGAVGFAWLLQPLTAPGH